MEGKKRKKKKEKRMILKSHVLLLLWEWTKGQKCLFEVWTKSTNFILYFLLYLGRFIFYGPRWKTPKPHQFSLIPLLLTNYPSQLFSLIFSFWFFSIFPKITPTKHILKVSPSALQYIWPHGPLHTKPINLYL